MLVSSKLFFENLVGDFLNFVMKWVSDVSKNIFYYDKSDFSFEK